jgi:recombinational DNA repair ATPase RecF
MEMDSKTIDKNIYAITHRSMQIYIDYLKEMNKRLEIMSKSEISNDDKKIIEICDKNMESFSNILNKNTSKLSIDIDNYLNTIRLILNTTSEVNDLRYNDSVSVSKQAMETDKLIYVMFISYLISIIITNNISDI